MAFLLPKFSLPLRPPLQEPTQNARHKLLYSPSPVALTRLDLSPPLRDAALQEKPPPLPHKPPSSRSRASNNKDEFYLNLGLAVRTLRNDLPSLFSRDLNYDIYREDVTFIDPLNTFHGIENYRLIFWALRLHGRILFREIGLRIIRVWQPSENIILIRWELQGVPRVPWEAQGRFQGTSWYKLDRNGKIYEHKVDNLALNFPRAMVRSVTVMDLVVAACPPSPNLTFSSGLLEDNVLWGSSAWLELYRAVRSTLEQDGQHPVGIGLEGLITYS